MHFPGIILAIVSPFNTELVFPVAPYKTDISVQVLSTTITSGSGASGLVIKFGVFFTFLSW